MQNVSSRVTVGSGEDAIISGFVVSGSAQTVVVRALGPTLTRYGVVGALPDPILELHNSTGAVIATNDNWPDTQGAQFRQGGAYRSFQPPSQVEPAIVITLQPGAYSAVVRGKNGLTGVALAEVYLTSSTSTGSLSNVSCRALVGTGENVLIGGLSIGGNSSVEMIIRAMGPSLARFGVTNPLPNPMLQLFDGDGTLIGYNDDWRTDASQAARISSAGFAPPSSLESSLAVTLSPGNYTAIVRGGNNTTGVALLEAYQISSAPTPTPPPTPTPVPTPTPAPTTIPYPKGVWSGFDLLDHGKVPQALVDNKGLVGLAAGEDWNVISTGPSTFDWTYLDRKIAAIKAAGFKYMHLNLTASSDRTPQWVFDAGAQAINLLDPGQYHATFCQPIRVALYWDPIFHNGRKAFIRAAGARYASDPAIVGVTVGFANHNSSDWNVQDTTGTLQCPSGPRVVDMPAQWRAAGWTTQKMFQVGKDILQATAEAFPNQMIKLAIGTIEPSMTDPPTPQNELAIEIVNWAFTQPWADRFIVQRNTVDANWGTSQDLIDNPPGITNERYIKQIIWDHSKADGPIPGHGGLQSVQAASRGAITNCRQGGGPDGPCGATCNPGCVLETTFKLAETYNLAFYEIWPQDAQNSQLYSIVEAATLAMGGQLR